jgi:tetratricopeptide (TPR) repeat protein
MNFPAISQKYKVSSLKLSMPLLLSLSLLLPGAYDSVLAQDSTVAVMWPQTYQKGLDAMKGGDFQAAEKYMMQSVDIAKNISSGNLYYVNSLEGLAVAQTSAKDFKEAEKTFSKLLALKSKTFADTSPEIATTRANLANLYFYENQFKQADALYRAALANLTPDSGIALEASENFGQTLIEEGKFDEAATLLNSTLEKFKTIYGPQSLQVIYGRLGVYNNLETRGDYKTALIGLMQLLNDPNGLNNSTVDWHLIASCMSEIAACYLHLGQYADAEAYDRRILELHKARDGDQTEDYGRGLQRLGQLYTEMQKYKQAEELFHQASAIIDKKCAGHTYQATLFLDIAKLHVCLGRYDKAESLLNSAIEILTKALDSRHPDVAECLIELAYVKAQKNRLSDAEKDYNLALSIDAETIGRDVPAYSLGLSRLGQVYASENKLDDAEKSFKEALSLREQNLPAGHPNIARSMSELADFYRDHAQPSKAETMYRRMMSYDEKYFANRPALKISAMEGLEASIRAQGKSEYADGIAGEAAALKKKIPGYQVIEISGDKTAAQPPLKIVDGATGSKWALCVGISSFQDPTINLKYAAKDATDFSNFLVAKGNFPADHVHLLTDENASREGILGELGEKWLGHKVKKNDLVVIYISSHGSQSMQQANNTNFLVAYDTNKDALLSSGIPMQRLTQIIKEQVPSDRILLVLDVCHSGSVVDGEKGLVRHDDIDVAKLAPIPGQIVVCSSSSDQISWESKEYPNSVFTRRLIQALDSQGTGTSLTDAYKVMKAKVEEEVLRDRQTLQNPAIKQTFQGSSLKPLAVVSGS